MTIGIIGAGALGANLARAFASRGIGATIANSRGPASLASLVRELGPSIRAVTTQEAASADVVIAALRWVDAERVFSALPAWHGRIVVDATNPVEFIEPGSPEANDPGNPLAAYGIKAVDLGGRQSSQVFSQFVAGARVVKAFNHLDVKVLSEPAVAGGQRVLFYSGDDGVAKSVIRTLIEDTGFAAVDLGSLAAGGALSSLPFGSLAAQNFIKI